MSRSLDGGSPAPLDVEAREFCPSARTDGPRSTPIAYIVLHSMESAGPGAAGKVGRWFQNPDSKGSAHLGVDESFTHRYLDDHFIARGAPPLNGSGLHIEQAGFAEWSRDEWLAHKQTLVRCAFKVAEWCRGYAIPIKWLDVDELAAAGEAPGSPVGITTHANVAEVWRRTDHWDPGPGYPADVLLEAVREFSSKL